jgi:hypothetical protein
MPFAVSVAVDQYAQLPAGSMITLTAPGLFGQQTFDVTTPASFANWIYPAALSTFPLTVEVVAGHNKPIRLSAVIPGGSSQSMNGAIVSLTTGTGSTAFNSHLSVSPARDPEAR